MSVGESPDLSVDETLEVLRNSLDADAFEIAAGALRSEQQKREKERALNKRYGLVAGMVAGYEHILLNSDLAHTQGALVYSSVRYLQTPVDGLMPEDLDASARLYAAYFLASEPYEVYDYTGKNYDELLAESGVDVAQVLQLLGGYNNSHVPIDDPLPLEMSEITDDELFYGESLDGFLQFPEIIPKLKTHLYDQGFGTLYEELLPKESED
jgi:hypothetical protein